MKQLLIAILVFDFRIILETLLLGILASLIVAVGVEIWKSRRKKYHISMKLDSSEIYSPRNKSEVSIKVDYKGKPIDQALVILHLSVINDGQNDIMFKSHFSEAIRISSKGYKFLSISTENDKVKPICELCEDGAQLSWEILKKRECIKLNIAAQSEKLTSKFIDRVDCYNNLSFDFRSDCIDSIESSHEMTQQDSIKQFHYNSALFKFVYMGFICVLFLALDMYSSSRYDIAYNGQTYQNANILYTPLFKKYIINSDNVATRVLDKEDVLDVQSIIPSYPVNAANWISSILEIVILVTIVMTIVSFVFNSVRYSRYKRGQR